MWPTGDVATLAAGSDGPRGAEGPPDVSVCRPGVRLDERRRTDHPPRRRGIAPSQPTAKGATGSLD